MGNTDRDKIENFYLDLKNAVADEYGMQSSDDIIVFPPYEHEDGNTYQKIVVGSDNRDNISLTTGLENFTIEKNDTI